MINKKLLATAGIVGLFAGSAFADVGHAASHDLSVKIGGMFDGYAISRAGTNISNITENNAFMGFATDSFVWLEAMNTTAKGLEYGAHVGLTAHAQSSRNPANATTSMDNTYMWVSHKDYGRMEFGSNDDVSASMRVGADTIAVASGGISGNWFQGAINTNFLGKTTNGVSPYEFILTPWDVSDNKLNLDLNSENYREGLGHATYQEKARKLNLYSPKWYGVQAGFSWTPDSRNVGNKAALPNAGSSNNAGLSDVYSAGLTWDGKIMNDLTGGASLVGVWGSARPGSTNGTTGVAPAAPTRGVDVGGMLMYKDMKAALSYGYLDNTGFLKNVKNSSVQYATAGLAYNFDKLHTSLTYMYGSKNKNTSNIASLGAEYALATGIMPYAEATYYDLDLKRRGGLALPSSAENAPGTFPTADAGAISNLHKEANGVVFIIGTKLKF